MMQVEAEKYAAGIKWLKEILYSVQFTKERLLVVAKKMINDVSRYMEFCPLLGQSINFYRGIEEGEITSCS